MPRPGRSPLLPLSGQVLLIVDNLAAWLEGAHDLPAALHREEHLSPKLWGQPEVAVGQGGALVLVGPAS